MSDFFTRIGSWLTSGAINIIDIIDIFIVGTVLYQILKLFKNTKAIHVFKGLALLVLALAIASWIGLPTITWLLSSIFTSGIIVVVILFQPEIRLLFENFGRGKLADSFSHSADTEKTVNEFMSALNRLAKRKVGALIVFEQKTDIKDIIASGVALNAEISSGLIENVFEPNTPLHDGAMIITGSKISAAGCFLPLSENPNIEKTLGTRHRAALGMSEHSDSIVIVVSEETGVISSARNGNLNRYLDSDALRALLTEIYSQPEETAKSALTRLIEKVFSKEDEEDEQE